MPKSTLLFSSNSKWKPLAAVYTDILHLCGSKFTQACSNVHVCVLYYGPVLQVNGSVCAKSGVAGHVQQVVAQHRDFQCKIIHAWNFGPKGQVVFDNRNCKQRLLL